MKNKRRIPTFFAYILSFGTILLVWSICSKKINAELILPPPSNVLKTLKKIAETTVFWKNFFQTFIRVVMAFFISLFLGSIIGFISALSSFFKDFFELPIAIIRTTPVIAVILIAYFWFKSNFVPVFVTVLMTLPIMITAVTTGMGSADENLLKMAKVYNFSKREILKYIKIPACKSYFWNGAISCFGLSWKVVAAGEVICLPKYAVGTLLQKSQMHLETSEVLAQTIILVAISFFIERIFSFLVNKGSENE